MKYVGQRHQRIDAVEKVTGRAKYTYDMKLPGMLYGKILRSAYPRARVVRIDASKAAALPGVKAIILPDDEGAADLLRRECRYAGQEVAAVAATTLEIAEDAMNLIEVQYTELPFVVHADKALESGAAQVQDDRPNGSEPRVNEQGDINVGFAESEVTVEAGYKTEVHTHVSLETHGSIAHWENGKLTVWASTQAISATQGGLSQFFGIPNSDVRVIKDHMGGGFGSKLGPRPEYAVAALLARKAGVPVKLMLTRKEEHITTGNRPDSFQNVKIGAKKNGKLVAYRRENFGTGGIAGRASIPGQPYLYEVPNFRVEQTDVYTHGGPQTALRAPGHPQAAFAMESVMDELAAALDMDPMAVRQMNDPDETRRNMVTLGAERFGWDKRRATPGPATGIQRGMGMGAGVWGGGGGRTKAEGVIHPDGSVEIRCGTQDVGVGTKTVIAQIAAEEFGLTLDDIIVKIGDTNYPPSGGSGGSTTCASVSPAVKNTVQMARLKLFDTFASSTFGVSPHDLEAKDGKVYVKSDPSKSMTWQQAAAQLGDEPLVVQGQWVPGLSSSGVPAVQFIEVEVNTATGVVKVVRVVAVNTSGLIMNPLLWESQVNGGVLMGIGYGLYEERIMDPRAGYMVNPNLEAYRVMGAMEIPEIEVVAYNQPERGVIGIGEPPFIPTAPAIANAVYNACGARVRAIPITPDKVLAALAERREG
ncbi:MAG: xanthine dehydrogenase family protein molybdopterin-binding subunit [Candidatus Latescibacteria bacterium]|nr:xanthine dehydrogenase family protein molybdopterin-binding subunit [Candidatus Latescibacterota bacterium]